MFIAALELGFAEIWLDQNPALKVALPSTIGPIGQTAFFSPCLPRLAPLFSFFFHSLLSQRKKECSITRGGIIVFLSFAPAPSFAFLPLLPRHGRSSPFFSRKRSI